MRQILIVLMMLAGCASAPSAAPQATEADGTSFETGEVGADSDSAYQTDSAGDTASETDTETEQPTDNEDSETDIETEPASDDTDSETVTYDYEMIQDLSGVDDSLSEMVEQEGMLYFTFAGRFVLCRVDVNGEQVYECMSELVSGLTVFDHSLWWNYLGGAANYLPETDEITSFPLGDYAEFSLAFTVDASGMYFTDHGCKHVVGMNHKGDVFFYQTQDYAGYPSYYPYITTNENYIFCSGSSGAAFSAGKLYGVPKTGGDIVEITSAPTTNETNFQHTTGPMKVVDDTLYYFHFYTGGADAEPGLLLSVPAEGGESTIVFNSEKFGSYESPLVYDESRRVFYFTFTYSRLLYKYDIDGDAIKTVPIEYDPQGQVAVDDIYIYWYMNQGIYKMKKF